MPLKKNIPQPLKISKAILVTAKILESTSPKLAARFAMKIFTTPVRFKIPVREQQMDSKSRQEMIYIPKVGKNVNLYHLGTGTRKALLVHGWSGRGTQLYSIADALVKKGYSVISFDAPAHGKSEGSKSEMTQFIACINEINTIYGPFEIAIGHSLGAMSVLNAIKDGLSVKRAVIIGSGDIIQDIMYDFTNRLGMSIATADRMMKLFEKRSGQTINNYSAYIAARNINIPVLIVHDENDTDVPVQAAYNIHKHLKKSELVITTGLGHRKILGDSKVMKKIVEFLEQQI